MFFPYTASVILLSLAIYGLWCFLHECWVWYIKPRVFHLPSASFLLIVRNMEQEIEMILRQILRDMECARVHAEAVVVEAGSDDLTPRILVYLAGENPLLKVVYLPRGEQSIAKALPLCEGAAIYVFDLVNRMNTEECLAAVREILRR